MTRRATKPKHDLVCEVAALKGEVANLRSSVERLLAGDDPDDPLLTIQEIAALTKRNDEAVRLWFAD
jgi:hypothetical protein